ncbi:NAD-dependent epimerase/dehydratase family protein [Roseibaca sp. Y0-43]|uniref:NAD-dependent epimerase/dehydratase family protein n=1 Tax=Roseibaca sp. Y0-43 TaxID=2816854 RepID=UPI001D0BFB0E|nr:NAD(P)-dependent oxidoreductase [Roseibaca sp. Y0-43]MCC1481118.1 NAD-dependent epimerase/dehydratase family protein [Roseibaca sp. Y0-43]
MTRVLVMGASGRIGAYLRQFWHGLPLEPVWQFRSNAPDGALLWNPLAEPVPDCARVDAVLCLAGVTSGPDLGLNTDLALAGLDAARRLGAGRVLLASSVAVYGADPGPHPEDGPCTPANDYGRAKLAMEQAARGQADMLELCCLRIGNVAGADALLGGLQPGRRPVLHRFADGQAPRRAYIGPRALAHVLAQLACHDGPLPPALNIAQPGLVGMDSLLRAAGQAWDWADAPAHALPELRLSLDRQQALCPLPAVAPDALVAEWRLTWAAAAPTDPA